MLAYAGSHMALRYSIHLTLPMAPYRAWLREAKAERLPMSAWVRRLVEAEMDRRRLAGTLQDASTDAPEPDRELAGVR